MVTHASSLAFLAQVLELFYHYGSELKD